LTPQAAHVPTPVAVLYVPAPQGMQATPLEVAAYPAIQVQDTSRGLPTADLVLFGHIVQLVDAVAVRAVEYVFTPHEVHTAEPVTDFHLPAPQGVHAVPSTPVYPARQVQFVSRGLPIADKVLFGHKEHVVDAVAVRAVE
jgi:hypothetical protein